MKLYGLLILFSMAAVAEPALTQNAKQAECNPYADEAVATIAESYRRQCPHDYLHDELWAASPRKDFLGWCIALPLHDAQIASRRSTRDSALALCKTARVSATPPVAPDRTKAIVKEP